ncbi:MAG: tellurite resistance TerB family protein [Rhodobacteraceae bacterium]|nr:tellurite resistance TerB family protein [Paracoccaceae bacterium]
MSFMGTLTKVAMGFAAAKGLEQYNKMGGMAGLQSAMGGQSGADMVSSLGDMAEKFGLPGGKQGVQDMMAKMGLGGAAGDRQQAGMAGLGGLMAAMGGAASAGTTPMTQMFEAMAEKNPLNPMVEDNAKLMIRAMIQAAKADGEIDAEEQAKIIEHLGDATPDELEYVKEQLAAPLDLEGLAASTQDQMKAQVYSMSLMTIRLDSASEKMYLDNLARALGLSDAARAGIHQAMGAKAPS